MYLKSLRQENEGYKDKKISGLWDVKIILSEFKVRFNKYFEKAVNSKRSYTMLLA